MRGLIGSLVVAVLVLVLVLGGLLVWSQSRYDSFHTHCAEQGGHIYKPDMTSFCLTGDGRFLEVYP